MRVFFFKLYTYETVTFVSQLLNPSTLPEYVNNYAARVLEKSFTEFAEVGQHILTPSKTVLLLSFSSPV